MPPIDRIGNFKGIIKDFGIGVTRKKEYPQLVVTVQATALYDEANEVWDDWSEYDQVITGYFVLVTLNDLGVPVKCLNYDQVMEATGWDGVTYSGLAAMKLKGTEIQFRVQEDTYNDNTTLKMNWIAGVDAGIGLRKLSGKDLTDLDAKFGAVVTPKKTAAKPKAAKPRATPPKRKAKPQAEATPGIQGDGPPESCTEEEAFDACVAANIATDKPVPEKILGDYWLSNVDKIAADPGNVTDLEWPQIREAVMIDLDIPF